MIVISRSWCIKRVFVLLHKNKVKTFKTAAYRKFSQNSKRCIFSAIQPSGILHIGNYLGAIKNWVNLQNQSEGKLLFSIADLHSLTVPRDAAQLQHNISKMAVCLLACGIDPQKCILFQQSKVYHHTELAWVLSCLASSGHLNRMHQWKNKGREQREKASLGLYAYPVLMAADILVYRATDVPVGEDQLQHLELTRELARIFNNKYGSIFPYPRPIQSQTPRIMSLRQPDRKMSKSDQSSHATINVTDDPDVIRSKISKAVTDSQPFISYNESTRPGVSNLLNIYSAFSDRPPTDICKDYEDVKFFTDQFKRDLTDLVVSELADIRREAAELEKNLGYVKLVLDKGKNIAGEMAETSLKEVRELVGLS